VKKIFALLLVIALSIFSSCQKQQTDAERQAEIDRQVQQRLDAEHQAQEKEKLAQREDELNAREKALEEKQDAVAKSSQRESRPTHIERATRTDEHPPTATASYDTFYTQLDRYGDWRETSDYGYVWQPRQAQSRTWRPYTDGHWVYTDVGWTWVSEEPFGWATYHYGRWTRLRNIGWVWVPGDEWAPAWVSWRKSNDYIGWAPLPPEARFDRGTGIHNWSDSYYDVGPDQYCFVETKQFGAPRLENAVIPSERNVTIVNQTTNVTNITYNNTTIVNQGPSYDEIRTQTQQPIERLRLEREVNVNINLGEPRPVVRGQAIVVPAPLIARSQAVERPRRVKETIANVVVDRGWENTGDRQATEKVRVKMKAEATPPSHAPPKTFVKPTEAAAETSTTSASSTSSPATAATAVPSASVTSTSTPASSATIAATSTPVRRATPETAATATATPSATARVTATPVETATPRPTLMPRPITRSTSSPSASRSAIASPAASAAASQTLSPTSQRSPVEKSRSRPKPSSTPAAIESASPSPSSSASPTPNSSIAPTDLFQRERREMKKEERQANKEERRKEKRRGHEPVADERNSTPTITPTPAEQ
jgi:cell division protein FtsB